MCMWALSSMYLVYGTVVFFALEMDVKDSWLRLVLHLPLILDMLFGAVVGWLFLGYNARYARPSFQGERQFASLSACLSFSLLAVSN